MTPSFEGASPEMCWLRAQEANPLRTSAGTTTVYTMSTGFPAKTTAITMVGNTHPLLEGILAEAPYYQQRVRPRSTFQTILPQDRSAEIRLGARPLFSCPNQLDLHFVP